MKKPKLTIIVPAFNEKKTISKILNKILSLRISKQIIIVDDKSNDGTRDVILKYKKKN